MNTKFKEAIDAVKTATLDLDIAKMAYKHKLKKGKETISPTEGKTTSDKPKKHKKAEGKESPQATVIAAKAALDRAKKERNEAQEQGDVLSMKIL